MSTTTYMMRENTIEADIAQASADLAEIGTLLAGYVVLMDKPDWTGNDIADALEASGKGLGEENQFPELVDILRATGNAVLADSHALRAMLVPSIKLLISDYEDTYRALEHSIELLDLARWK